MKTKQIFYIAAILIAGIIIGKFIFSSNYTTRKSTKIDKHKEETIIEHWTCSMHPQIDMPEPGQCPICGMDLIPKENAETGKLSEKAFTLTKRAMQLVEVETMKIGEKRRKAVGNITLTGSVTENKENTATQTTHIAGRIEKMYVQSEGDFVRKGQKIALIYSPDLVTAQNELLQAMYIKDAQPELYRAVRQKLKYWKLTDRQINQIENSQKVIPNMPVYADYAGYISEIKANEGTHLKEGGALYKITDLSTVWIVADIYEKDLENIINGQAVEIRLNVFPGKVLKGKINYIEPTVNTKTRTAEARIVLSNNLKRLKPGMLAQIDVKIKSPEMREKGMRILLPKTAVLWTGKRSVVYIKLSGEVPAFEMKEIKTGKTYGDQLEVLSGLIPGDEVVINGVFTIDASAQLQGKPSMMNPKGNNAKTTNTHAGMDM